MHIARINEQKNPLKLSPGDYVCEDANAGELLANGWASEVSSAHKAQKALEPWRRQDLNGKKLLFVRPGGFGDLLFITPTVRGMKRLWPECQIYVACFENYKSVLENNSDVSGWVKYPILLQEWETFDSIIWLEGIIEKSPEALHAHAVDVIALRCGLELTDKRMKYVVTKEELASAISEFPDKDGAHRIGVQMTASALCRMYPHMRQVVQKLWQEGHEVFLFGKPGEIKTNEKEGIVNLTALNKSFRESCAVLMTCDCLVAPDSALTHIAGALNIPCVALYGPFPWNLRTAYSPSTRALQGIGPCAPCFHHAKGLRFFPENGPCANTGRCEVLASISVDRVIREVEKKLETRRKAA